MNFSPTIGSNSSLILPVRFLRKISATFRQASHLLALRKPEPLSSLCFLLWLPQNVLDIGFCELKPPSSLLRIKLLTDSLRLNAEAVGMSSQRLNRVRIT